MFKTANEAAAGDNKLRARIYRLVKNGVLQHREESGTLKINYEQLLELLAQDAKESSSAVYAMSCAVRNEHPPNCSGLDEFTSGSRLSRNDEPG